MILPCCANPNDEVVGPVAGDDLEQESPAEVQGG